jgi:hypothetical protein
MTMTVRYRPTLRSTELRLLVFTALIAVIGVAIIVLVPQARLDWSWSDIWVGLAFAAAVLVMSVTLGETDSCNDGAATHEQFPLERTDVPRPFPPCHRGPPGDGDRIHGCEHIERIGMHGEPPLSAACDVPRDRVRHQRSEQDHQQQPSGR